MGAGVVSVEDSFREVTAALPPRLRAAARTLPHRLGLAKARDGRFEDFVILHPNRDLPGYAAEGTAVTADRLRRYRRAHHLGGFCWLLRDRLADGQVAGDTELL